ncbi:MAG: four helix bundle protein [Planctomycetes bacterium]|nr:four helix bundle protein [Planctomycetota bacterium]
MMEPVFDHDKLDVYRLSIAYVTESFRLAKGLSGMHRHARDQWLRAAQSIALNIAEGNGKPSLKDRCRSFAIARGSALECAAIQDVLTVSDGIDPAANREGKQRLKRIVSMLTRLVRRSDGIPACAPENDAAFEHGHGNGNGNGHDDSGFNRRTAR